jgi:carboxyl-terminal processing protease
VQKEFLKKRFNKIKESVAYYSKRREDTQVTLNLAELKKEDEEAEKIMEKLKLDEKNEKIIVTEFEASLKAHQKVLKGEEEQWKKDFEQRKEEWITGLQKDPGLEESLYIIDDMLKSRAGKKLSMVK